MTIPLADPRPCTLYRHFAADGSLLYVGITFDPAARQRRHADDKSWWAEVARTSYEHLPNRDAALAAEEAAIKSEHPRWNVMHNSGNRSLQIRMPRGIERTWYFKTESGCARRTSLWLEWEIDGASVSLEYDPMETSAREMLQIFARRSYPRGGWAPIIWMVMPEMETAPFQISHARHLREVLPDLDAEDDREHHLGMLACYTWPKDVKTGERLNFMGLPVPDRAWTNPNVTTWTSGFIQEATGWKPGALQPYVNIDMLLGQAPNSHLRIVGGDAA